MGILGERGGGEKEKEERGRGKRGGGGKEKGEEHGMRDETQGI